jgi:hypothetical protein
MTKIDANITQQIVEMNVDQLKPHPDQDIYNPPCSAEQDAKFNVSIAEGQRDPIHALPPGNVAGYPDYTILDGHRRWGALKANGIKQAKVLVRGDLLHAEKATVDLLFLGFNENRRHYDCLALANSLKGQLEIQRKRASGSLSCTEKQKLAASLAKTFSMSLRNAQRYVHAAHSPLVVQNAHRNGHLRLTVAARVGQLPKHTQDLIAKRITSAGPKQTESIVAEHMSTHSRGCRQKRFTPIALRLIHNLQRDLADLDGRFEKLHGPTLAPHRSILEAAKQAIDQLLAVADRPGVSIADAFRSSGH